MSDANISLVQDLYAAFARGDVSTILSACAPDVDWRLVGRKDDYPTFGAWQGPGEVEKFFQLIQLGRFPGFLAEGIPRLGRQGLCARLLFADNKEDWPLDRERMVSRVHHSCRQGGGLP